MKTIAAILFAFLLVWQPATAAGKTQGSCCGETVFVAASCCCVETAPLSSNPAPPVPAPLRSATQEPITLLLPTVEGNILLERSTLLSPLPEVAPSGVTGVTPLFERDCALLI